MADGRLRFPSAIKSGVAGDRLRLTGLLARSLTSAGLLHFEEGLCPTAVSEERSATDIAKTGNVEATTRESTNAQPYQR